MKCPKCGYISFDHNATCPKCRKDINDERKKLNLPGFEPAVPFLLGALTGDAEEAGQDMGMGSMPGPGPATRDDAIDMEIEEVPLLEEEEDVASFDDDLDISLEDEWTPTGVEEEPVVAEAITEMGFDEGPDDMALESGESIDDLGLELDDMDVAAEVEESVVPSLTEPETEEEEIPLDLEDLAPDTGDEEARPADDDLALDLDELGLDEDEFTMDVAAEDASPTEEEVEGAGIELDSIALDDEDVSLGEDIEEVSPDQDEEVVLNLDDLKINETGELEIGSAQMDAAPAKTEPAEVEETLDLEELGLDDSGIQDGLPGGSGRPAGDAEDLTIDLDELSLDDEIPVADGEEEEELSLDFDDLELDLDLDDEEVK